MKKYDGIKYRPYGFNDKGELEQKVDIFNKIEKKIFLTRDEIKKNLLIKKDNGECWVLYEGREREGVIISSSSNGSMTIGILKDDE